MQNPVRFLFSPSPFCSVSLQPAVYTQRAWASSLKAGTPGPPGPHLIVLSRVSLKRNLGPLLKWILVGQMWANARRCCQWRQYSQSFFQVVHVWYPVGIQTWKWVLTQVLQCVLDLCIITKLLIENIFSIDCVGIVAFVESGSLESELWGATDETPVQGMQASQRSTPGLFSLPCLQSVTF